MNNQHIEVGATVFYVTSAGFVLTVIPGRVTGIALEIRGDVI